MIEKQATTPTGATTTPVATEKAPPQVPRWLVRTIWAAHRAAYRVTGGRFGLRPPAADRWGMLRLTTTGRRSGKRRVAIHAAIGAPRRERRPARAGDGDRGPRAYRRVIG